MRLRVIDAGFPRPDLQICINDRNGVEIARIDMGYKSLRIASEYDGKEFHTSTADREHDEQRRDYLHELEGWRFVVGDKRKILGPDAGFELCLGKWLDIEPRLPRMW
ncbi:hypothetical protein CLV47_10888 [Antricoccus suffuscus]|uniref:Uncharacterized protein n=2 Tax=Antricoccus suffuscus TaxID=1629062 RepID=A0A2T0ZZE2_9ACTN|nr:hypothetical protein CLV47_10888 [Antricoccus suffuscus]